MHEARARRRAQPQPPPPSGRCPRARPRNRPRGAVRDRLTDSSGGSVTIAGRASRRGCGGTVDFDGSPTATRPGSTTSHQTPNGNGSRVGTSARYFGDHVHVSRSRSPVSGSRVVTAHRPTCAWTATTAPPTRTCWPISRPPRAARRRRRRSSCGSGVHRLVGHPRLPPSAPRASLSRRASRRRAATVDTVTFALCPRDLDRPSRQLGQRLTPRPFDHATHHRPPVEDRVDTRPELHFGLDPGVVGEPEAQAPVLAAA